MSRHRFMLFGLAIIAPVVQGALLLAQANRNFEVGMDFRLTYTAAVAWSRGANPYDDATLKRLWARQGMPQATPPGWPQTPNVYPLTIAPLLWPLAMLPFPDALGLWTAISTACIAVLLVQLLRPSAGGPLTMVAAGAVFFFAFPLQYGYLFGNLAVVCTFCLVQAMRLRDRPLLSGVFLGLALVKYSLCAPLAVYWAVAGRWRAVAVAGAVQVALIAAATYGAGLDSPMDWIEPMLATASRSLEPGWPNHYATLEYTAFHLELAALLHRLSPALDSVRQPAVAVLAGGLFVALYCRWRRARLVGSLMAKKLSRNLWHRRLGGGFTGDTPVPQGLCEATACLEIVSKVESTAPPSISPSSRASETDGAAATCRTGVVASPEELAVLAVTLLAFYHRAYDSIVVLWPLLAWLVCPVGSRPRWQAGALWLAAVMIALPGPTCRGGSPAVHWIILAFVQPAAIWGLLVVAAATLSGSFEAGRALRLLARRSVGDSVPGRNL